MCADFVIGKASSVIIKSENIAEFFVAAYEEMPKSAFEHPGIYPYCSSKFTDVHFKSLSTTNREISNRLAESCVAENANIIENQNVMNNLEAGEGFPSAVNSLTVERTVTVENLPVTKDGPNAKIISRLQKIIPIPKTQSSKSPSKSKSWKSVNLTGSPFKNELVPLKILKKANENIKELRLKLKHKILI